MRSNLTFLLLAFLMTALLSACAPIQDTNLPLPEIATSVVGSIPPPDGSTPSGGGEATPAPDNQPATGSNEATTMLAYGLLALAGLVFLVALFAILRKPDTKP